MPEAEIIATGSKGNAVLLSGCVLIDCGVPLKTLEPYIPALRCVLITHRHGDHLKLPTLRAVTERRPGLTVICPEDCAGLIRESCPMAQVLPAIPGHSICLLGQSGPAVPYEPDIFIRAFAVPHDVPCLAYWLRVGSDAAFYATDCKDLYGIDPPTADLYLIEANYADADLQARTSAALDRGSASHERRVRDTHMSREDAMQWLMEHAPADAQVILLHQHHEEERPE